ncbi:putative disease resistance protein RGA1 [Cocos nucifera]|uniref:Putative disease resistance protein RGA1 n=1 Tax=Cocos nucifera TaxID=13894 RepID=A0A8K0NCH7_COCNU|nr:putative disease resistance protein RGA1 [Cocos nucifera]
MGMMEAAFLEGLAKDAYWEFFSRHAFGSQNPEEHPELEAIGKKIADRLKGSPLAAKTLGSLLNSDLHERHWRNIMNSEIWELKQGEDDIIPVLQLSYQCLPACLKQCITYCSIFPKDYEYKKDELVPGWHKASLHLKEICGLKWKCGIQELPGSIGKLKLLRYLDVSENNIPRLPESLCNLYNLLVLNISDCLIENFPARMTNLVKLRQLKADEKIICKLANIGKLTSLQELPKFKVVKERRLKIEELKDMMQLHGRLRIENLENVKSKEEASQAKLNNKHYLDELELVWNSSGNDDEVLEGLKPHSILQRLEIRSYGGVRFPSWLEPESLKSLKAICLENIQSCGHRPPLGQLPFLKILHIKNMRAVKLVGHEFYGSPKFKIFPLLEELEISDMPEWEEWFRTESIQMFPRRLKLHIEDCPKLKSLACLPPSLRELHLKNVGINMLPESWDGEHGLTDDSRMTQRRRRSSRTSSISDVYINGGPNLENLEQWLLLHHLPAIRKLIIIDCQKVVRLQVERFKGFLSLENLKIMNRPLPPSAVQLILPSSLRHLILASCGHLDESLPGCLHNLISLSYLELVHCPHITSLPGEVLGQMIALSNLIILECRELRSLGDLRALRSLENMTIGKCPRLTVSANEEKRDAGLAHLRSLCIDDSTLVKVLFSTITLPSLERLSINGSAQLAFFTGESNCGCKASSLSDGYIL